MSLHPSGAHAIMSQQEMRELAILTKSVHGLGILSLPLTFFGAFALTRRLTSPNRLAVIALVFYGFAVVSIMIAASMSGFVAPAVMSKLVAGDPMTDLRRFFLDYTFQVNQAFASVFVVGACLAIALWSVVILMTRRFSTGLGIYGVILGLGLVTALFSGKLSLDVHGFGLVTFTTAIWFIIAGVILMRSKEEVVSSF